MPKLIRPALTFTTLWLLAALAFAEAPAMSTYTGKGSVTQAIDGDIGAVFDIGSGITILFPKGIPVGHSRILTFQKAKKKIAGAQVQQGFSPVGVPLELSVPLNATGNPIVLSMTVKGPPAKSSQKLVLAMEIGTLCTAENKASKLRNGLCSGWELVDAHYDAETKRVIAELHSTGGMRMTFGVVPDEH